MVLVRAPRPSPRAFTLIEIMVVIGVLVLLLALLLPALAVARRNSQWAGSQNNLRQIYAFMTAYSTDNREYIVPSEFDYSGAAYPGKVRSQSPAGVGPLLGEENEGTWTDILWTTAGLGPVQVPDTSYDYRYDSPDKPMLDLMPEFDSIFRSKRPNGFNAKNVTTAGALPFGDGAEEIGEPGYFAANQFFDSTQPNNWWTTNQIKVPTVSVYLVDSFYGEVIPATDEAWDGTPQKDPTATGHVDFRYPGDTTLLLMLDGRILTQPRWDDRLQLLEDHQIRVLELDKLGITVP